jgi:hypothetical protein
MSTRHTLAIAASLVLSTVSTASAQQPTTAQFEQTLDARLQQLRPDGMTVRAVRFESVQAGTPNGGYYPFVVTGTIYDYGPGYPANRYYGETCVGRIDGWKFDMLKDSFGKWTVQGRMTADRSCKKNPGENVSAIPLTSVAGHPASALTGSTAQRPADKSQANTLYMGQWACYGVGSRLMAGMGFVLDRNGVYADVDGKRGGRYSYSAASSTITFNGGFLGGQIGRNVRTTGFNMSSTVSCEPWR